MNVCRIVEFDLAKSSRNVMSMNVLQLMRLGLQSNTESMSIVEIILLADRVRIITQSWLICWRKTPFK